jgi:hypothetical protein
VKVALSIFVLAQAVLSAFLLVEITSIKEAVTGSSFQIATTAKNEALTTNRMADFRVSFTHDLSMLRADLHDLKTLVTEHNPTSPSKDCKSYSADAFLESGLTEDELALINAGTIYSYSDDQEVPEGMAVQSKFKSVEEAVNALQ